MGAEIELTCEACGYEAWTSGGDSVLMRGLRTTVHCLDCKALYEAVVSEDPARDWG